MLLSDLVVNVFCKTGRGGGIDPGCKRGGLPGPKSKPSTVSLFKAKAKGYESAAARASALTSKRKEATEARTKRKEESNKPKSSLKGHDADPVSLSRVRVEYRSEKIISSTTKRNKVGKALKTKITGKQPAGWYVVSASSGAKSSQAFTTTSEANTAAHKIQAEKEADAAS